MSTLTDAIKTVLNAALEDVHTTVPGVVSKYDYKTQEAEVQPVIKRLYNDDTAESVPVIARVPVIFPRTATAIIHFPLNSGDTGLLLFSESALENWLSLGGEVEPGDHRRFDLSDAVFIPGLYPFNTDSLANNNDDFIAQYKGTGLRIKKNGDIEVGGDSFLKLINENFQTMFNSHAHNFSGFVGTGAPTPGFTTGPVNVAGTLPPPVPVIPAAVVYPGTEITSNEMTSKVKAE